MNEEQMKHVANLISQDIEKDKEINRLNNIIEELEKYLLDGTEEEHWEKGDIYFDEACEDILSKLKELKEGNKNDK